MEDTADQLSGRIRFDENLSRDYSCLMMRYDPPFDDIRVRQAFNLMLNRDEMILFLNDGDAKKCGPIPPAHKRYALPEDDPAMEEYFRTDIGRRRSSSSKRRTSTSTRNTSSSTRTDRWTRSWPRC